MVDHIKYIHTHPALSVLVKLFQFKSIPDDKCHQLTEAPVVDKTLS